MLKDSDLITFNEKVVIVCALEEELPPAHNPYRDITFYTGVGKCNATLKVLELIYDKSPTLVINFGTAGACNENLSGLIECGVFIDRDDSAIFNINYQVITDSNLYTISTGDNFITEKVSDCDIIDMEAYCLAKCCEKYNTKFRCFKYITDYVNGTSKEDWQANIAKGYPIFLEKMNDYI